MKNDSQGRNPRIVGGRLQRILSHVPRHRRTNMYVHRGARVAIANEVG